jgi:ADP-heptose:LPS heptosyltransferase/GT2 family glycosyltransferase
MDQHFPVCVPDTGWLIQPARPPVRLTLEQPKRDTSLAAGVPFAGVGWLLAPDPILGLTVWLDDQRLASASLGLFRPDVAAVHPTYADNCHAGFAFIGVTPRRTPGPATLRLVIATTGATTTEHIPVTIADPPRHLHAAADLHLGLRGARIGATGRLEVDGHVTTQAGVESHPPPLIAVQLGSRLLGFATLLPRQAGGTMTLPFRFETPVEAGAADGMVIARVPCGDGDARSSPHAIQPTPMAASAEPRPLLAARIEEASLTPHGVLIVSGWAVCQTELVGIEVQLNETPLGPAQIGLPRGDVGADYPLYPASDRGGFHLERRLAIDQLAAVQDAADDGVPGQIRLTITAAGGLVRDLASPLTIPPCPIPSRPISSRPVLPNRAAKTPPEVVPQPPPPAPDAFLDTADLTASGDLALSGWAVCPSGVASIAVDLATTPLGSAELGFPRPDVATRFPTIETAARSGFRFTTTQAQAGTGADILTLTILGHAGERLTLRQPVTARPDTSAPADATETLKFYLDEPAIDDGHALEPVRGFLALKGWAFARGGPVGIEVFIDGRSQGHAHRGIRRPDLQDAFPDWDALRAGFAMLIAPQSLSPGTHVIRLEISGEHGERATQSFDIAAEPAAEGPGPWQLRRKIPQAETDQHLAILAAADMQPAWSLLLPIDATASIDALRATIATLRHQAYPDWRLTIAAPPEATLDIDTLLTGLDDLTPHITLLRCAADTLLIDLAPEADLVVLLSPGDRLGEDALLELSLDLALTPDVDFLYSDERRIDPSDGARRAFFKPDWSPDLLLSTNYIGRLWAARAGLLRRAGLTIGDLARFGDYDAVLRLCEQASRVSHVRKVLCSRADPTSDTPAMERFALHRAARRHDIRARILPGCLPGTWRFKRDLPLEAAAPPLVSIIIASVAARGLIEPALRSIRDHTAWPAIELIIIDNIGVTDDPGQRAWKRWMADQADLVIELDEPFNWSRSNNLGAAAAAGDILLFLNDDIEVRDPHWLHGLLEHAQRPEVGVVGPQLLYPDGRVQHAGMFLSPNTLRPAGRHAFRYYPHDAPGRFGLALTQRNVISVTGACMMLRRAVFDAAGGFDEAHAVINNDLDFCLRVQAQGQLVVYTPYVQLIHHEMASRAALPDAYDSAAFDAAWRDLFLHGDPYFHPVLSGDADDYIPDAEPVRDFQVGHPLIARHRVRRILAVKLDHIGDFIAALPAFRRLKEHFPNAELCVLAANASLALAHLEPAIDRIIEFNFFHARSELGPREAIDDETRALAARLAAERFDIAIDLRRQADTRHILPHTGARWLAGFDQDHQFAWLDIAIPFEGDVALTAKHSHVSENLLHLADAVGIACETDREVARTPAAETASAVFTQPRVAAIADRLFARPVVCLHAGAGAANKQWPASSFAALIDLLVSHHQLNALIIGGPDETDFAASILAAVRQPDQVFSLAGAVALRDLPDLLLSTVLYVGNDSGPKHLAAAIGVPTIGIHSGSVDAGEWGALGPAALTVRRDMSCGPCYIATAADCPRALACLTGIKVGDIYQAAQRLLLLSHNA